MIKGYMESSLSTSEVFQGLNSMNKDKKIVEKAIALIKTAKHLTIDDIEASYIAVKQISESLTTAAIKAFESGDTVIIFNDNPKLSLSQTIPFLTFKTKTGYTSYIFIDRYITISRDGTYNLQPTNLRDLLIGALISNALKRNYGTLSTSPYLARILMSIYTQLFCRITNKDYSVGSDKVVFDSLQYYINKFFLINVFNMSDSDENINNFASKHFNYIDEIQANQLKQKYDESNPSKLSELLPLLSELSPRMKNINMSTFLSSWMNYYYIPSMLAVDNIEYLIFMILSLLSGNNIINTNASDIVKETKGIKDLRGELLKLL